MEFTAAQIAQFVQGRVEGDENATVNTFAKIEEGKEGAISFLSNPKDCGLLVNSSRGIIYASNGEDFAEVAGQKAKELQEQMAAELAKLG